MDERMPDDVRAYLNASYDVAREMGLDPAWHDDADGFDYLCPQCLREGKPPHFAAMRMQLSLPPIFVGNDHPLGPAG
jgi:hypothetical protein